MTLDGTNTWLLAEPGASSCVVVDPGPDDAGHLRTIAEAAGSCGQRVGAILLTHSHHDHAAGAPALARLVRAPVLAYDAAHGSPLGADFELDGLHLDVVPTPGHSADSVCFVITADRAVLTGDHVLGRGTSLVEYPDGRMGDYLQSLVRVRALDALHLLPGHGPVIDDPRRVLDFYQAHREGRLAQIHAAVAAGDATPGALVRTIYPEVRSDLRPVAELNVRAGLELLVERGLVVPDSEGGYTAD
ncbi:MAG: MBL fold metallo-hydrolase [Mycobacteriales bacterium]